MTAQTLRDAAKVLRERAENATPEYGWSFYDGGARDDGTEPGDSGLIAYISLMSPVVGLALADWLDREADEIPEWATHHGHGEKAVPISEAPAVRVACAILGES